MSNEIATTTDAGLPAMYGSATTNMKASDIIMPRIETVQGSSGVAKEGIADEGDIVFRYGSDDADPSFLVGGPDKTESSVVYVLLNEKFAATTAEGFIDFHPTPERDLNDPDSWEGWRFYIAAPSIDPFFPASWMLWRTAGAPAARQINTMLARKEAMGDYGPLAIKVSVKTKANKKGLQYKVPVIGPATADPDDYKVASEIKGRLGGLLTSAATENEGPRTPKVDQPSYS